MKKVFLFLSMIGLALASCTPDGGNDGNNGGAGGAGEFTFVVSNIGEQGADISVTPKDETRTYYWQVTEKKNLVSNFSSTKEYMEYVHEYLEALVDGGKGSWETGETGLLFTGTNSYSFKALSPETTYYAYAFGVDTNGNLTSADLSYYEFTTNKSTFDTTKWIGTWNVTSPKVFVQFDDDEGNYMQTFATIEGGYTREIEIVDGATLDSSLSGLCCVYGWDGFILYELPALGQYVGNTIELMNNEVVYEYEDGMVIQWIAMSAVPDMGYDSDVPVGGDYPPYTFYMDNDGSVEIKAYVGELTTGSLFNVLNFNCWPVRGEDIYVWSYKGEEAYTFSGDVMTAVKTAAEDNGGVTPAKLSAKKNIKVMHKYANAKSAAMQFSTAVKASMIRK